MSAVGCTIFSKHIYPSRKCWPADSLPWRLTWKLHSTAGTTRSIAFRANVVVTKSGNDVKYTAVAISTSTLRYFKYRSEIGTGLHSRSLPLRTFRRAYCCVVPATGRCEHPKRQWRVKKKRLRENVRPCGACDTRTRVRSMNAVAGALESAGDVMSSHSGRLRQLRSPNFAASPHRDACRPRRFPSSS